ncbi:hypothetical protein [Haloglomus litoreum]|uniref:hypothetical protein n=1 Tax=Haloglomus litoreum TaxID=3034026 RepID=UPI0023E882B4|nr:hypothetical protein [Haloglomus sp. DT116]
MVHWRAVGIGLVAYPATVLVALATEPAAVLVAGVPPGVVAGYDAGNGMLAGGLHGTAVGVGCTLLTWLALAAWLTWAPPASTAPGFGLSVVLLALYGLLVGIESILGGLAGGVVPR